MVTTGDGDSIPGHDGQVPSLPSADTDSAVVLLYSARTSDLGTPS